MLTWMPVLQDKIRYQRCMPGGDMWYCKTPGWCTCHGHLEKFCGRSVLGLLAAGDFAHLNIYLGRHLLTTCTLTLMLTVSLLPVVCSCPPAPYRTRPPRHARSFAPSTFTPRTTPCHMTSSTTDSSAPSTHQVIRQ